MKNNHLNRKAMIQRTTQPNAVWKILVPGILLAAGFFAILDPNDIIGKDVLQTTVNADHQIVGYELLIHERVRLGLESGACEMEGLRDFRKRLASTGMARYFVGIPVNGTNRYSEYVNLLYIDHFDRLICGGREYYVARFSLQGASCNLTRSLKECGINRISKFTYDKWVAQLVQLGLGRRDDYQPRKTIQTCECSRS